MTHDESPAEPMREESEESLALALAAAGLGLWRWNAASDRVTLDAQAAAIFGLPPGAGTTWTRMRGLLVAEDRDRARIAVETAARDRTDYDIEYRIERSDGVRWIAAKGRPLYHDDGALRGMLGVVHDVSERKNAEQALMDESRAVETVNRVGQMLAGELDLQRLVQALTDAATEISGAEIGAFFYNQVAGGDGESYLLYTLTGAPREAFAGYPMPRNTALFGPTFRGEGVVRLDDVTQDPRYGQNPPYHGMPAGHLPVRSYLAVPVVSRTGEVIGGLFFGHGTPGIFTARHERLVTGIAGQAAIAIDNARLYQISREAERQARERAQELAEADRRKDEFLAVLAHELRNPLGAISNALHVMGRTTPEDPRFKRAREVALRQLAQQRRLIDDLLDVSRIGRGKIQLQLEVLELDKLVRQSIADHQLALEAAGLTVVLSLPDAPVLVRGDSARLTQVVGNLLDNARKFTLSGGTVTVELGHDGSAARLRVRDTGVGIDPAVAPLLFTPFAQADRTLHRSQGGLGLGLALVRGLLELHGGEVTAESAGLDRGATFTLRLPLASAAAG